MPVNFVPDSAPTAFQSPCGDSVSSDYKDDRDRGQEHPNIGLELNKLQPSAVHRDDVHRLRRVLLGVGFGCFEDVG